MPTLGSDIDQTRGRLLATRLVLQEALDRVPADQFDDLRAALEVLVIDLRDALDQAVLTGTR